MMNHELCAEHLMKTEQINNLGKNIDDLRELIGKSVDTVANYVPKIEQTLAQFLIIQDTIRDSAKTHKDMFTRMDQMRDVIYDLKLMVERHQIFIDGAAEDKRDKRSFRNQIFIGLIIASILWGGGMIWTMQDMKKNIDSLKTEQKVEQKK